MTLLLFWIFAPMTVWCTSDAGSSSGLGAASLNGLQELLRSCFDANFIGVVGPPKNAKFTLEADDEFRHVTLTFNVLGTYDGLCTLLWDAGNPELGENSSSGSIKSVYRAGSPQEGQPIPMQQTNFNIYGQIFGQTGIRIDIYNKDYPHWELISFFPSNLLSGKFLRSFIAQGLREHSKLVNQEVFLRTVDSSLIRELYWLETGHGKTYFEEVWNLEYDCIVGRFGSQKQTFLQASAAADKSLVLIALASSFPPPSIRRAFPGINPPLSEYSPVFLQEVQQWISTKRDEDIPTMTIRDALNEFIPRWRNTDRFNRLGEQIMAQNTFMFFFRTSPNFDTIARQVLLHYDETCNTMTGIPIDHNPRVFTFQYQDGPDTPSREGFIQEAQSEARALPPPSISAAIAIASSRVSGSHPGSASGSLDISDAPDLPGSSQDTGFPRSQSALLASHFGDLSVLSPALLPQPGSAPGSIPGFSLSPPVGSRSLDQSFSQPAPLPPQFSHLSLSSSGSPAQPSSSHSSPEVFRRASVPPSSLGVDLSDTSQEMTQEEADEFLRGLMEQDQEQH